MVGAGSRLELNHLDRIWQKANSWRLPVRIPVPNRDNLIAMGLMALAFGLMVGVAIGPALGAFSNASPSIVVPGAATVAEPPAEETAPAEETTSVALSAPAGSETVTTAMNTNPGSDPVAETPADTPTYVPTEPEPETPGPNDQLDSDDTEDGGDQVVDSDLIELSGVVVGVGSGGRSYTIADSSGNQLAVHSEAPPVVAAGLVAQTLALNNGTFAEEETPVTKGLRKKSKLRGTISWIDPLSGIAVLSSRGSSVAVNLAGISADLMPELVVGSSVDAVVTVAEPVLMEDGVTMTTGLTATSAETYGDPLSSWELNGKVETVDAETRMLTIAADSSGLVPATVTVNLPKAFDPELALPGKTYSLSVEINGKTGRLLLTGLSADYSRKSADDAELAFGNHS